MWCLSREGIKDGGRQKQKCNLGPSALFTGVNNYLHYINTYEIPGEFSLENLISSHLKISPWLWLLNKSRLSHQKTIKVKWFGSSLVYI